MGPVDRRLEVEFFFPSPKASSLQSASTPLSRSHQKTNPSSTMTNPLKLNQRDSIALPVSSALAMKWSPFLRKFHDVRPRNTPQSHGKGMDSNYSIDPGFLLCQTKSQDQT